MNPKYKIKLNRVWLCSLPLPFEIPKEPAKFLGNFQNVNAPSVVNFKPFNIDSIIIYSSQKAVMAR